MTSPPRYLPDREFPPYTYVPGQAPHPIRDPAGHMHGEEHQTPELMIEKWWKCDEYLWGIDLFNHGYYWEAHEAWEGLWHAAGRSGPMADFLKGLIKLAAAGVKTLEGSETGRRRHASRAAELFQTTRSQGFGTVMGLSLDDLSVEAETIACEQLPATERGEPAAAILSTTLTPEQEGLAHE